MPQGLPITVQLLL